MTVKVVTVTRIQVHFVCTLLFTQRKIRTGKYITCGILIVLKSLEVFQQSYLIKN